MIRLGAAANPLRLAGRAEELLDVLDEPLAAMFGRQAQRIVAVLERHKQGAEPRICSYASVRHRHQGRTHFVDMHLRVPRAMTVAESHDIATRIEREVLDAVGEGTATAHMEPCGDPVCRRCAGTAP